MGGRAGIPKFFCSGLFCGFFVSRKHGREAGGEGVQRVASKSIEFLGSCGMSSLSYEGGEGVCNGEGGMDRKLFLKLVGVHGCIL